MDTRDQLSLLGDRSQGITFTERRLVALANRTFLKPWSFANPFRDQGHPPSEICDLLIICDPHVIIFSDKQCTLRIKDNVGIAWKRWHKRAVDQSIDQLYGAERWIRSHPDRIYIDSKCHRQLPLAIPPSGRIVMHRVVVASGAAASFRTRTGGTGSLMIIPSKSDQAAKPAHLPFTLSESGEPGRIVHVLDEVSLKVLLSELDTINDFIGYLTKRERLIASGQLQFAASESDLLATYLTNMNDRNEHDFPEPKQGTGLIVNEGVWDALQSRHEYLAKRDADELSYAWDRLIDEVGGHAEAGTLALCSHPTYEDNLRALRIMAQEPRLRRRMLSHAIVSLLRSIPDHKRAARIVLSPEFPDVAYVFLLLPRSKDLSDERYREARRLFLTAYCAGVQVNYPNLKQIVGIGTESGRERASRSHDIAYIECSPLSEDDIQLVRQAQAELGILDQAQLVWSTGREQEYPTGQELLHQPARPIYSRPIVRSVKVGRNELCPCGSGRKFKKCCGMTH